MMRKAPHRYPIGRQTFSELIEEGFLYVDKTEYVYNLTHSDSKYIFLSRPRRFGKSLLASTLRSYFEGRKELFAGLAIDKRETEWRKYPVLHFSMAGGKHMDAESLNSYLDFCLSEWERIYGKNPNNTTPNTRLQALIRSAWEQTGEQVVVIIDEYDAPLLDVMCKDDEFEKLRNIMRNFYSPLKDCDPYLRFAFMTGITKFSQLSIFSELNNILNISMLDEYAGICGITKEELLEQMSADIDFLAHEQEVTREDIIDLLKRNYDGYHFSKRSPDIYNPFSLLTCFSTRELKSYWFGSGTPTFLIEMLRKFGMVPAELGGVMKASESSFDAPTESLTSIVPLLYQSGYVTIKGFDRRTDNYILGIPNTEVRVGLMQSLIRNYLNIQEANTIINEMSGYLIDEDIDGAFLLLQKFFKAVPYCNDIDHEGHWQQMLYVFFSIFGAKGDVEVHTSDGRVDLAMTLWGKLYLIEVKLDKTAREALEQIDIKEYDQRFAMYNMPIIKVGVNFSTKERTITEWEAAQ